MARGGQGSGEGVSSKRVLRIAEGVFLVGGLVLWGSLLHALGAATVLANLRLVGWGIAPIVLQEILAHLANTLGWLMAFPRPRPPIPLPHLLAARIAGDAINYVTPTATLGGEFARARFLKGGGDTTSLVASIAVAKVSQAVGQVAFVIGGLAIVLHDTPLPPTIRHGLLAGLGVFAALAVVLVLGQRRGIFAPMWGVAQRLGLPAPPPEFTRRLQRLDEEIARFHGAATAPFFLSSLSFFIGWAWGVAEIYLILWLLGVPATLHRALAIEVLSVALDGMLFFVPAKVGTQEGGKVLIFTLLGLDPAKGLSLGILRRIRELSWALVGLLILSRRHLAVRPGPQPPARSLDPEPSPAGPRGGGTAGHRGSGGRHAGLAPRGRSVPPAEQVAPQEANNLRWPRGREDG